MDRPMDPRKFAEFASVYRALAGIGFCDAPGSSEFWRVYAAWKDSGEPPYVNKFIIHQANSPMELPDVAHPPESKA